MTASAVTTVACILLICNVSVFGQTIRYGQVSAEASGQSLSINCGAERIKILSASYGTNCNLDLRNNQLFNLEVACNNLNSCNYLVDHRVIGDPAPNCAKTYQYLYRCMNNVNSGLLTAEAHSKTLTIDCGDSLIQILSASYGRNCRSDLRNQQTRELVISCQDRSQCYYKVDVNAIGDPAYGCAKTYEYSYQCQSYQHIGCFADTGDRALRYGPGPGAAHSIDSCAAACSQYAYFALEYGTECFCDDDGAHATKYGPSGACDKTFVTGGVWSFNLFANVEHGAHAHQRGFAEQVVDGEAVTWSDEPFNVAVLGNAGECSGSIISLSNSHVKGVILTAAHCNSKTGTVKIGVSDKVASGGDVYTISKWLPHPNFKKDDGGWHGYFNTYDAALIFLDRAITTSGARAVSIGTNVNKNDHDVTVYGYGYSSSSIFGNSGTTLRKALTRVVNCYYFISDHNSQFCTYPMNGRSCQGDSGGPVLSFAGEQVGINSYGENRFGVCYQNGFFEEFKGTKTDITGSAMKQWIQSNINAY